MSIFLLFTVLFVALKLTHVIAWSWWWVLSPAWGEAILWVAVLLIVILITVIKQWVRK